MIATVKKTVVLAALIAAGLVAVDDLAMGRAPAATEVGKQMDRHPDLAGTPTARIAVAFEAQQGLRGSYGAGEKSDRMASAPEQPAGCAEQTWPRIAPECLVSARADGRKISRTITVEKLTGLDSSALEKSAPLR